MGHMADYNNSIEMMMLRRWGMHTLYDVTRRPEAGDLFLCIAKPEIRGISKCCVQGI
jgi:hypothetical protein